MADRDGPVEQGKGMNGRQWIIRALFERQPIQPEAMDVLLLKRRFGRDLAFCGGVPTQDLLPRGTPGQVRDEVRRLKEELGGDGGYVLEPGITLQADVPLENLVAMTDEARR